MFIPSFIILFCNVKIHSIYYIHVQVSYMKQVSSYVAIFVALFDPVASESVEAIHSKG